MPTNSPAARAYEVLLDGIDEHLDALPARLDPATADDGWKCDYLLGWLASASSPRAPARFLLVRAAEILDLRLKFDRVWSGSSSTS